MRLALVRRASDGVGWEGGASASAGSWAGLDVAGDAAVLDGVSGAGALRLVICPALNGKYPYDMAM